MTTTEVDRLLRQLTEMRVEAADKFARLETKVDAHSEIVAAVRDLEARIDKTQAKLERVGKFSFTDLYPAIAAAAAAATLVTIISKGTY